MRIVKENTEYRIKYPESSIQHLASGIRHIAIFASGTGSNAQKIIDHFRDHPSISVSLIVCNKPGAGVLAIADAEQIPVLIIEKDIFFRGNAYVDELRRGGIEFIVLAGFLWKIPQKLIDAYRNKIINIHPALLPNYGGKGMYGSRVHEAVINAGEKESGITIHYVDEHYDNGDIIFQAKVNITDNETPESLAEKIHSLEHKNYPKVIEQLILVPNGS
ncbi:MAG: phosphoribosylglycinamide formyltransferase [Chitinophagaceae bacterium]|nr:phosphoribosylglycinamide formyltransferase [Chitinophagaceae bacterium]